MQNTFMQRKEDTQRSWLTLDASGKTLGRFASEVTKVLRGKHRPNYTPNIDCGDGVIIINADKIRVTGAKEAQKIYRYYTGYMSGMREIPYRIMMGKKPHYILEHAISGMMPKTRLGKAQLKKLRIFKGPTSGMPTQQTTAVNI